MSKKYLYIAVSLDKYELPIAVADNVPELARMMGTTVNVINSSISRKTRRYHKVERIEEEGINEC